MAMASNRVVHTMRMRTFSDRRPCRKGGSSSFLQEHSLGGNAATRGSSLLLRASSSASTGAARTGIVVAAECDGLDNRRLFAAVDAVRNLEGCEGCAVEAIAYGRSGGTPGFSGSAVSFSRRARAEHPETYWSCSGSDPLSAIAVATDPEEGLFKQEGINLALAVVGINREKGFLHDDTTVEVARRAAINGVPTVAVSIPSSIDDAPLDLAVMALTDVLGHVFANVLKSKARGGHLARATNSPRQHFPFPTRGRWSSLGTSSLPADFMRAGEGGFVGLDFSLGDCWSLGEDIAVPSAITSRPGVERDRRHLVVEALREAFEEGDSFLVIRAPAGKARPASAKAYAATRPAVMWRQSSVTLRKRDRDAVEAVKEFGDLFGRTLPAHRFGEASPTSTGARFVSQLQTERLVGEINGVDEVENSSGVVVKEYEFEVGSGTLLHDRSSAGDADAVLNQMVSVSTTQTWPAMHAFSLTDQVMVESLRENRAGLPAWLCESED
ncbi:hypothetical protein HOP50_01g09050 [Chloropicon primus]|uniref:Survival protein SurE-like phosphatase/nucleotidase domain-containing protein n=1 Tax=Chloropicon primus TaxID=1764295 RepID=A0A5B8MD61_9CHLO|nr:hypothetical protein A3770_01p09170 [Chloropicon primus]UPQ97610.1 hypothetical protein HOP50_01g09050 [Chloropicon primus]|eukprot:QDZ18399.1 hypothetical protein A3770_01p09170 [Chloropicon primus]